MVEIHHKVAEDANETQFTNLAIFSTLFCPRVQDKCVTDDSCGSLKVSSCHNAHTRLM